MKLGISVVISLKPVSGGVYHRLNGYKLTGMVYYNRSFLMILVNDANYIHCLPIFQLFRALSHYKYNPIVKSVEFYLFR